MRVRRTVAGDARYDGGHFKAAVDLFMRMSKSAQFDEFLSLPAYELLAGVHPFGPVPLKLKSPEIREYLLVQQQRGARPLRSIDCG